VSYLSCDLSYFSGLLPVKAKARKLLDEATKIERGKAMLEQHRVHRDAAGMVSSRTVGFFLNASDVTVVVTNIDTLSA
jgi:hypothetical protein